MTYADWHIPLSRSELTLREGLDSLAAVGARQQAIPLIVRLLGLETALLAVYYRIEMERYPDSVASQRLLD